MKYKIEKQYLIIEGLRIQYVVIDLVMGEEVARYDSYENAESWIVRKLIGDGQRYER